jgi:hypothetical protein
VPGPQEMLTISTWLWGDKYTVEDVCKLQRGVKRNINQKHRFVCVTERERHDWSAPGIERWDIVDRDLLGIPGCFARLRMFDRVWQLERKVDDRLVCVDLDSVVLGLLDPLFDRPETFVILGGANSMNPCPFNGSLMMLRPGNHGEVWSDFSIEAARRVPFYEFPDDQGWIWHKLPNAATWQAGRKSGVLAFKKPGWPHDSLAPPPGARLVVFPGKRSPQKYRSLQWVKDNWW